MKRSIVVICIIVFLLPLSLNASKVYKSLDTANAVIRSLKTESDKWRSDQFRLYYFKDKDPESIHKNRWDDEADCHIWVANGEYAIEIQHPKRVKFSKEAKKLIWGIYQEWANGHFAKVFSLKEVFPDNEIVIEEKPEVQQSEFQSLTSQPKPEKKPNDFFSLIPKWFLIVAAVITVLAIIGLLLSMFLKKRKEPGYAG